MKITVIEYDGTDRLAVARATYKIVASFADPDGERGPSSEWRRFVSSIYADTIEAEVARLAPAAEGNTIRWNGRDNAVVMEALDSMAVADDYVRMKRGDQAEAFSFGGPRADGHLCPHCGRSVDQ